MVRKKKSKNLTLAEAFRELENINNDGAVAKRMSGMISGASASILAGARLWIIPELTQKRRSAKIKKRK